MTGQVNLVPTLYGNCWIASIMDGTGHFLGGLENVCECASPEAAIAWVVQRLQILGFHNPRVDIQPNSEVRS